MNSRRFAAGLGSTVPLPGSGRSRHRREVPPAVISRLPEYLRVLDQAFDSGEHTLPSAVLAARLAGSSARVRKDLSLLGFAGTRGVGYDVAALRCQISDILGRHAERAVAIVGAGHLGRALAAYPGFTGRGLRIAAAFDADPAVVGSGVGPDGGIVISAVADMADAIPAAGIRMAILAVPGPAAQEAAERLVACGVVSILNFAPVALDLPDHVHVRRFDLSAELQVLAFHERSGLAPEGNPAVGREAIAR